MNIIGRFFLSWGVGLVTCLVIDYFEQHFSQPEFGDRFIFEVLFTGGVSFVIQALLTLAWLEGQLRPRSQPHSKLNDPSR